MSEKIPKEIIWEFLSIVNEQGFAAYLIGGSVISHLQSKEFTDIDICLSAQYTDLENYFDVQLVNKKFGSFKIKYKNIIFECTTFRVEDDYTKHRYPRKIIFVDNLSEDIQRRDFTINAIALDCKQNIYDEFNGIDDFMNKKIVIVGGIDKINEDSLRIVRALRFAADLEFDLDDKLEYAITLYQENLKFLSRKKVQDEIEKVKNIKEFKRLCEKYKIDFLLNVLN